MTRALRMTAIALVGIMALAGCQKIEEKLIEEEPEVVPEQPSGSYTLTLEVCRGVSRGWGQ